MIEPLIIAFIYSMAKVLTDSRKDQPESNLVYALLKKLGFGGWYRGGNENYNPSLIWTADFWHRLEHVKSLCVAYPCARMLNLDIPTFFAAFFFFYIFIGRNFELWYRFILPYERAGSVWTWLKQSILFWKNYHKAA